MRELSAYLFSHSVEFSRFFKREQERQLNMSLCLFYFFYAIDYVLVSNYKMHIQSLILFILLDIFVPNFLGQILVAAAVQVRYTLFNKVGCI